MRRLRRLCVCPLLPLARLPASGSGSLEGGRVHARRTHRGRKTAKGRHGFATPWREPRVLGIDSLDEQGQPDRLRVPLYDVLIGNAEAVWARLIGYLRLLGAAYADVVEFIADGAEWIGKRGGAVAHAGRDSSFYPGRGPGLLPR